MKNLVLTLSVIVLVIATGIGISALAQKNYIEGVASAREYGYEKGFVRGYENGLTDGSEDGYQEGSRDLFARVDDIGAQGSDLSDRYFLYNPSCEEVMDFLEVEDLRTFSDIHNYAVTHGIRVAYVRCYVAVGITGENRYMLELAAFDTVDRGMIVIEPWSHRPVVVEEGKIYRGIFEEPNTGGQPVACDVTIVW
jgi:hypothetical protein